MDSNGFGSKDNGKLEARDDVLVFTGPVISEPQEVIGPVSLRLRVRGSSPNFDVFARLCDVDAKGTSWNICDGLLRLDATPPADADGWTEIEVPMSATAHRFSPGHHLRVQVPGGAHPRWARNTGTSEQIATATSLVPRPRPRVPGILLLCVNVADDWIRARKRTECQGRRLICMPLRTQSG